MRYQVKTVRGAQADMAREDLGLIKISRSSAEDLFDLGVPIVLIGNNVNSHWFFGPAGYNAMTMDADRFRREGVSFKSYVNNWAYYNEQSEGRPAFFVDQKHVAGAREVTPRLTARQRRRGGKGRKAATPRWSKVEDTHSHKVQRARLGGRTLEVTHHRLARGMGHAGWDAYVDGQHQGLAMTKGQAQRVATLAAAVRKLTR